MDLEHVAMKMAVAGLTAKDPSAVTLPSFASIASSSSHQHAIMSHACASHANHSALRSHGVPTTVCRGTACDYHGVARSCRAQRPMRSWAKRRCSKSMLSPHQSCGVDCSQSSRTSCCGAACCGCHGVSCGASRSCVNHAAASAAPHAGSGCGGYGASCQPQPIKRRRSLLSLASSAASTSPLHDEHQHPRQQLLSAQHALMNLENFDEPRSATGGVIGATRRPIDARGSPLRHSGSFTSRRRPGSSRLKAMWGSANTSPVTSVTTQSQSPTVSDEIGSISRGTGLVARGVWGGEAGLEGVNGGNGETRFGGFPSTCSAPNLHAPTQALKFSSSQSDSIKAHPMLRSQQPQALMQQLLQLQQADPSPSHSHPSGAAGGAGTTDAGGVAGVKGALGEAGALGAASAAVTAMAQQLSASTLHGTQRPLQSALRADRRQLFDSLWLEDSDSLASPACAAEAPAISGAGKRSWGRPVKDTWWKQQEQLQVQQQQQHVRKQFEVQQEKKASKAAAALAAKDGLAQLEAFMEASMGRTAHSNIAQEEEDLRSLEVVVMGLQSACLQGMDSAAAAAAPAAPTTMNEPGASEHAALAQDKHAAACELATVDLELRL